MMKMQERGREKESEKIFFGLGEQPIGHNFYLIHTGAEKSNT